jgi:hypothetical protein
VKRGGIKKKSHINALKAADSKTGRISNKTASKETVSKRIKATTWYLINSDKPKHNKDTNITMMILYKYCLPFPILLIRSSFMFNI